LGISRVDIQAQINSGKLQTHEGYVTTDSLRLADPNTSLHSEHDDRLKKMQQIKDDAMFKSSSVAFTQSENEKSLMEIVASLKSKIYKEEIKNQHYEMVFEELGERLDVLEKCCHAQDKEALHKLQGWVKNQAH
jgi:hemoglobin-like flavoprotein